MASPSFPIRFASIIAIKPLPRSTLLQRNGHRCRGYPALKDATGGMAISRVADATTSLADFWRRDDGRFINGISAIDYARIADMMST